MKSIFKKIWKWIIKYQNDIILIIGTILISLFSFAAGFITAKYQNKEPIRFEQYEDSDYWGRDNWPLSCLETL